MFNSKRYIKILINEAMEEAFGKRNVQATDDFDFEDEYNQQEPDNGVGSSKIDKGGKGFQGGQKYMKNKAGHEAALGRMRQNLPFNDDAFAAPWMDSSDAAKNPHNKTVRDPLAADAFGRIKVMSSPLPKSDRYNEPVVLITMVNIDPQDCVAICKQFARTGKTGDVVPARTRQNNTRDGVTFVVPDKFINQWKEEDFESILNFLSQFKNEDGTPKYFRNEQDKESLRQYIENRVKTGSDISDYFMTAKKNNIELFNAFIEAESDQKVDEFIQMYQRFGLSNMICSDLNLPVSFGRILSTQNAALVLGSGKLTGAGVRPTFILTERVWREKFGRVVNPNAVFFPIWVPSRRFRINQKKDANFTSTKSYTAKDASGQDVEITQTSDVLNVFFLGKKWNELSQQQKIAANIMCNYINPSECYMVAEFDVSDTTLVDPNGHDEFSEEIGLANRFTGELNQAAANFLKTQNMIANISGKGESEGEGKDGRMDAFSATMEQLNEYALKNVNEYCEAKGIKYRGYENDVAASLLEAMKAIAKQHISLKKDTNIEMLVNDAVYATCKVMKICLELIKTLRIGKPTNEIEYSQYSKAFSVLMDVINGNWKDYNSVQQPQQQMKMVSENTENQETINPFADKKYSKQELAVLAANALPDNKIAQDSFSTMLERMEKSKKNLKY